MSQRVEQPGVVQQPGQPPGQQRWQRRPFGQPRERRQPAFLRRSSPSRRRRVVHPVDQLAPSGPRRRRRARASPAAGRRRSGRAAVGDRAQRGGVGAAHVAVARSPGPARAAPPSAGRRPRPPPPGRRARRALGQRLRQVGEQAVLDGRGDLGERGRAVDGAADRAVAADGTVVPLTAASTSSTSNSGCQRSAQVSRNVPLFRRADASPAAPARCRGSAAGAAAASGRGRRAVRRSRSSSLTPASLLEPQAFRGARPGPRPAAAAARRSGTSPSRSPTTSRRVTSASCTSSPPHSTDRVASVTSASPAERPAAQRGQGLGQPDGLDHVRGGDRQVLLAQHARRRRSASAR